MGVTEEWNRLMATLAERGSADALTFLPPAAAEEVTQAESATAVVWPDQLKEFYSLHNGQDPDAQRFYGELLPAVWFFRVDYVVEEYAQLVEQGQSELEDNATIAEQNVGSAAGSLSWAYLPQYIPLAGSDGEYCVLDTRPGEQSGCIRRWSTEVGDHPPIFASIADMLAAVRHSITTNTVLEDLWIPTFLDDPDYPQDQGALNWIIPE